MSEGAVALVECPKCRYQRRPADEVPEWQCPACGIAYHKYAAYLARARQVVEPRPAALGAPGIVADRSVWTLVGVNLGALVVALVLGWQLIDLMAVYWVQSVVIGISYFARIMNLEKFSTENFRINNRAVEPTEETKRQTAWFFLIHFGGFHLGYLAFIAAETPGGFMPTLGLLGCGVAFAFNHYYSYRYHLELDRQGTPNIGALMFTPYARIIPMHIAIVYGAVTMDGSAGIILFGLLKTAADVLMHLIEHWTLGKRQPA